MNNINSETIDIEENDGEPLINEVKELNPRTITTLQLMILVYFWTCAGPFGMEPAIGSGGVSCYTCDNICYNVFFGHYRKHLCPPNYP